MAQIRINTMHIGPTINSYFWGAAEDCNLNKIDTHLLKIATTDELVYWRKQPLMNSFSIESNH